MYPLFIKNLVNIIQELKIIELKNPPKVATANEESTAVEYTLCVLYMESLFSWKYLLTHKVF
jgi:hypothetical protein